MKRVIRVIVPMILVFTLLGSTFWYLTVYDKDFTRTVLVNQARNQESKGNHKAANWLYNLAYRQSSKEESVAIELADFFLSMGNYTKAEYTLTNAIMDGGDAQLYAALSRTYVLQGKFLDAVNMLDQITNPAILDEIKAMRPSAPVLSPAPGFYNTYIDVTAASDQGTLYVNAQGIYPDPDRDAYSAPISLDLGETTILALSVADNGLVSPLTVANYTIGGVVEEATLSDPTLNSYIRQLLGKTETTAIFTNELWDIPSLELASDFSGWEDLRYFTGLKELTLQGAQIPSLSFLTPLSKLETLDISDCRFPTDELDILAALTNLRELDLNNCGLSSLSGLEGAVNLRKLDLGNNTIRNLSALTGMTELEELIMTGNAVSSLAELSGLTALNKLLLGYNDISDITPLESLTELTELDLNHNSVSDLTALSSLTKLEILRCSANEVEDLSPLASCTELLTLEASENRITDLSPLGSSLMNLDFSYNLVEELPDWDASFNLVNVNGAYNNLEKVDVMGNLPYLNTAVLDFNAELQDISALANCSRLIQVDVFGTKVSNIKLLTDREVIVHYDPTQGRGE